MQHHHDTVPIHWRHQPSPLLHAAVQAFLGGSLTAERSAALHAYFVQWINAPGFVGPAVEDLRQRVDGLTSVATMNAWVNDAIEAGCDPL